MEDIIKQLRVLFDKENLENFKAVLYLEMAEVRSDRYQTEDPQGSMLKYVCCQNLYDSLDSLKDIDHWLDNLEKAYGLNDDHDC